MNNEPQLNKKHFSVFEPINTRWADNDVYGHVNNVTYYAYFDSAVNRFLIEKGGLDIKHSAAIAFVVNSSCNYYRPIAYPENIEVGVAVKKLGNSSVTYQLAVFTQDTDEPAAIGEFTHVFVDRASSQSTPIPDTIRRALQTIVLNG